MSATVKQSKATIEATLARISLQQSGLRWKILIAMLVITGARFFSPSIGAIAPPRPDSAFNATESTFNLVANSGSVIFMAAALLGGALADLVDRRLTFLVGTLAMIVANVLCMVAFELDLFWVGNLIAGIGAAITSALTVAIIRLAFNDLERPIAVGWNVAISGAAFVCAQLIFYLLDLIGTWRLSYVPAIVAGAIGFKLAYDSMPHSRAMGKGRSQEIIGITAWSLVLVALVMGIVAWLTGDAADQYVNYALIVGVIGVVGMVVAEIEEVSFSVRRTLREHGVGGASTGVIGAVVLGGMVVAFAFYGSVIQYYGFVTSVQQIGPVAAGFRLLPIGVAILAGGLGMGGRFDLLTIRSRVTIGFLALAAGIGAFVFLQANSAYWWFVVPMLLIGIGFSIASTGVTTVLLGEIPADLTGVSSGVSAATGQAGSVLGSVWLTVVISNAATRNYEHKLVDAGLPQAQVDQALDLTDQAIRYHQGGSAEFGQFEALLKGFDPSQGYIDSFTTGFHWAMAIAALVALAGAPLIWFGLIELKKSRIAELLPDTAPEFSDSGSVSSGEHPIGDR